MILYPAIDLKGGACVRLKRGVMDQATVYNPDPAAQARSFAAAGFAWIHVVDLDGAFAGAPRNAEAVAAILAAVALPVQLGGGIRDLKTVEAWLARGLRRVILGTAAVKNPALVREAAARFPGQVAVGIDARDGYVAVEGWAEVSTLPARDLALRFRDAGVAAVIFTDIGRDGVFAGVNVEATADLAHGLGIPVIASGGLASVEDVRRLKAREADGIAGVIIGRALYDGRIDPAQALKAAA
ncbi:MAG: 1-(5-phosphoribosyl)-5-[(5-phosphoribosylamino)methylideneamino]imidazole-4-carboxamide isomerase [Alphaproteobacteria bacterium]|nr:1-(5-phosphoribosyl)-5-[(5-phosphoribosylamino)methylideneamino]imidazole-4-carboxamide isomerase [Alphaproteobacteria bacterium]